MKTSNLHSFDLRIGNLLLYENRVIEVVGLNKGWIEYYNEEFDKCGDKSKYFHPIELTEEVLKKIGFKKQNDCYILSNEYIFFTYYKDSFKQELLASVKRKGKYYYNTNELKNYDIKYLHQLQNAYYLLTGEELEVSYEKYSK